MPNHVPSEMTLTFETPEDQQRFVVDFNDENGICQAVMPVVWTGGEPRTMPNGEVLIFNQNPTITFPDGTTEVGEGFSPLSTANWWGTKWGMYDAELDDSEPEMVSINFQTAWGMLSDAMLLAMIEKYNISDLAYFGYDEGMGWAASLTLELGDITTFIIDTDDFDTQKDWALSVNNYLGYDALDISWYDDDEEYEDYSN